MAVLIIIPALILLFRRIEHYYGEVGRQLDLGGMPPRPVGRVAEALTAEQRDRHGVVIVPIVDVSRLTELALTTAYRLGHDVVPIVVELDPATAQQVCARWRRWSPGIDLQVLPSPHRSLVAPIVGYVQKHLDAGRPVTVLLAEVQPRRRRHEILHNQRALVLAAALRSRTDAVVATVPYRLR